jgi:hypothetical protein
MVSIYIGDEFDSSFSVKLELLQEPQNGDSLQFDFHYEFPFWQQFNIQFGSDITIPSPYSQDLQIIEIINYLQGLQVQSPSSLNFYELEVYSENNIIIIQGKQPNTQVTNLVLGFSDNVVYAQDVTQTYQTYNWKKLDLFKDETMELQSKLIEIDKLDKVFNDISNSFTIPATDNNNECLKNWHEVDVNDAYSLNSNLRYLSMIEIDTIPFRFGKIELNKVIKNNGIPTSYGITFYGGLLQLDELFKDDTIDRLDYIKDDTNQEVKLFNGLSDLGYISTPETLRRSMQDPTFKNGDVQLPLIQSSNRDINYGSLNVNDIGIVIGGLRRRELRPGIRVNKVIELIEQKYKINFSRDFIGKAMFNNLYMWCGTKRTAYGLYEIVDVNATSSDISVAATLGFTINNNTNSFTFERTDTQRRYIRFAMNPLVGFEDVKYKVAIFNYGTLVQELPEQQNYYNFQLIPTENGVYSWDIRIQSDTQFQYTFTIYVHNPDKTTLPVYERINGQEFTYLGGFDFSSVLPKMKVKDFITGLMKAFKLIIRPITSNSFYLNTLNGYYADGNNINLTQFVDVEEVPITAPTINRIINLRFKETNNVLGAKFRENNDGVGYGDLKSEYKIDKGDTLNVDLPFENMLFERLTNINPVVGNDELTNILIGQAISLEEDGSTVRANASEPCLYFCNGVSDISNTPIYVNYNLIPIQLNYIHLIGNTNDELLNQVTDTINFGAEIDPWHLQQVNNSLYLNYWDKWITQIYSKKQRKSEYSGTIPARFLQELSLNDRIIINGSAFNIDDYTINFNGEVKLNLFTNLDDVNYELPDYINTNNIIANAGQMYYGIDVLRNLPWNVTKIDLGDGIDWIDIKTPEGFGNSECVIHILDKTNQTGASFSVSREMDLSFDIDGQIELVRITQKGL